VPVEGYVCSKCGGPLKVREATTDYVLEKCEVGHYHLEIDTAVATAMGGVSADVAAQEPFEDGKWVHLKPLENAE
jgi:hypothetical protein